MREPKRLPPRLRVPAQFAAVARAAGRTGARAAGHWLTLSSASSAAGAVETHDVRMTSHGAPHGASHAPAAALVASPLRFGLTVGKRLAPRSVDRNLVRRVLREAVRAAANRGARATRGIGGDASDGSSFDPCIDPCIDSSIDPSIEPSIGTSTLSVGADCGPARTIDLVLRLCAAMPDAGELSRRRFRRALRSEADTLLARVLAQAHGTQDRQRKQEAERQHNTLHQQSTQRQATQPQVRSAKAP